ncbi:DUF1127 domain-containing protein [Oceaniglobus trochenteri]|uniref:DUF1127 domain-containing protein n=1 Tax=Oceaniglobus trochenteri TaxID=2763260 RepID=UPI001CFF8F4A|nr:DUF1127 domain-containing protein [Oceaniglobus trochenteri]
MTTLDTTRTAGSGRTWKFLSALVSSLITWNDQRVTRKALSRLTNRELDDIGLVRGDIDSI